MKKILIAISFLVFGAVCYLIGIVPSVRKNIYQGHVKSAYNWIGHHWEEKSPLIISEPVMPSEYENLFLEENEERWKPHSDHTTQTFLDILSASPEAIGCCDYPSHEKVRLISSFPLNPTCYALLLANGNVITLKATVSIPSLAWDEPESNQSE